LLLIDGFPHVSGPHGAGNALLDAVDALVLTHLRHNIN
jgi:hypothetical protein